MSYRIGHGYDIHRLAPGRRFILGGVEIDSGTGPLGHSDGDALIHAVIDALLGATGEGDIGTHFPDTDREWSGAAGKLLLERVLGLIEGFTIVNLDTTVIVEAPRIAPHRERIRESLAEALRVSVEIVSVKAKTKDGLGAVGAGEAIECHAVVLLEEKEAEAWL